MARSLCYLLRCIVGSLIPSHVCTSPNLPYQSVRAADPGHREDTFDVR
jgi:hypothetical protein